MVDLLIKDCANPDRERPALPLPAPLRRLRRALLGQRPRAVPRGQQRGVVVRGRQLRRRAVILWGALTGKRELRDLGIFLHANLASRHRAVLVRRRRPELPRGLRPAGAGHGVGRGGKYDTWWDRNPIYVHGINFLPFTGGSLYLGRRPEYVRRNHAGAGRRPTRASRGCGARSSGCTWRWPTRRQALAQLRDENPHFEPEFGSSRAFVYQWLHALASYGQVDTTRDRRHAPPTPSCATAAPATTWPSTPAARRPRVRFSDGVDGRRWARSSRRWSARRRPPAPPPRPDETAAGWRLRPGRCSAPPAAAPASPAPPPGSWSGATSSTAPRARRPTRPGGSFEVGGHGWGNQELQFYTDRPSNAALDGAGDLVITARREPMGGARLHLGPRSITRGKFEQALRPLRGPAAAAGRQGACGRRSGCWAHDVRRGAAGPPAARSTSSRGAAPSPGGCRARSTAPATRAATPSSPASSCPTAVPAAPDRRLPRLRRGVGAGRAALLRRRATCTTRSAPPACRRRRRWVYDHPFFLLLNLAVGGNFGGPPDATTPFPAR